jgi:hypothetical protein
VRSKISFDAIFSSADLRTQIRFANGRDATAEPAPPTHR